MKKCQEPNCLREAVYRYSALAGGEKLACAGHASGIVSDAQRIGVRVEMVLIVPMTGRIGLPERKGIET
jgi:hypothetical protein